MKEITSAELREKFLSFMESKGHHRIDSASVIPENDPTVLFTTAGMHPLVPYLMGTPHPAGTRLTDVQKCIRTGDIDDVGDPSHLTFFEMLGNWSLGDYFKKEMIPWSWEFLTSPEYLGLPKDRLAFTVFEGDEDCPRDMESYELWRSCGVKEENLFFLPKDTNGNPVVPAAGTTYQLTLSGTFAQTTDASAVSSAPQISVDLQNVTYNASAQAASGLNLGNISLSDLKAGAMLSAAVADDGSFATAALSSPDGTAAVNTADGSGSVTAGGDLSVTITLQNAPGLAEVDLQYSAASAGETESADASAQGSTLRYFIPVQAQ